MTVKQFENISPDPHCYVIVDGAVKVFEQIVIP